MNIQKELDKLAALPSKAAMVAHLQKINETIPEKKDKIQVTGSIATLKASYKSYLEGPAAARENAGDSDDGAAKINPHAADSAYLLTSPECPISKITQECLLLLRSPAARSHSLKSPNEDLSTALKSIHDYVVQLAWALETVNRHLSDNYGENLVKMQQMMLEMMPSVVADPKLKPFFEAMGVEVKEITPCADAQEGNELAMDMQRSRATLDHDNPDEYQQDQDGASDEELVLEMNVIQDAILRTMCRWTKGRWCV